MTLLVRTLGIRDGHRGAAIGARDGFAAMVEPMPPPRDVGRAAWLTRG